MRAVATRANRRQATGDTEMKPYWKGLDYVIGIGDREFTVAGADPLRYMNGEKIGDAERKEVEDEFSGVTNI